MTNKMEQQATGAAAGESAAALMEEKINILKRRLEAKLARSHPKAHWEGMVEDCEIILNHLESRQYDGAGQEKGSQTVLASDQDDKSM
jgi:hypothetical protein